MNTLKLSLQIFIIILTFGCEARVLDENGSTIRNQDVSIHDVNFGEAVIVRDLNVKGVIPYVDMESGKVSYKKSDLEGYDFFIEVDFSVFQVFVKLGEDTLNGNPVEALNTDIKEFDEVATAPENGYLQDSNGQLVIGNKFYDGGNGWTGFHMTKNVYVFKTRSGKYAKVQFLKAKQGNVDFIYYFQQDSSSDLRTTGNKF